jgi:hypothetical protein
MWQTLLIGIIIGACALFLGRRFWRQWRVATSDRDMPQCIEGGCGCCTAASSCSVAQKPNDNRKGSTHG